MIKKLLIIVPMLLALGSCWGNASSSLPANPIDVETLKKNVDEMDAYQADVMFTEEGSYSSSSKKSDSSEVKTKLIVDGSAYSIETANREVVTYSLSEFAQEQGLTVDLLVTIASITPGVTANKEQDIYITEVEEKTDPQLFNYDSAVKQYIKYELYSKVVNAHYQVKVKNGLNGIFKPLMNTAINKGNKDEDKGEILFTFDDEFKQSEIYQTLLEEGCFASALSLLVKNNTPTKIVFLIDKTLASQALEKTVNEMTFDISFSRINAAHLFIPKGEVKCSHHGIELYSSETEHYYYCPACGILLSNIEVHDYDEAHDICKTCGYVKGTDTRDSDISHERKTTDEIAPGLKAFAYYETSKGEAFEVETFMMDGSQYYDIVGGNGFAYCLSEKVVITFSEVDSGYLNENSCVNLRETEYKLFKNVEIVDEGEGNATFDGKTLDEFVISTTPEKTLIGYNANLQHEYDSSEEVVIDDCHYKCVAHCTRCDKDVYSDLSYSHVPTNFIEITYADFVVIFGNTIEYSSLGYHTFEKNYRYYEAECSSCHKKIYMVSTYNDGYDPSHAEEELNYEFYEKEGPRTATYRMYLTLEHIDDGIGYCMFCHEEMA